jgi:hypothetical protein
MAIEALEGLTDEQLFKDANADEAPADPVVAEVAETPAEQLGQARDEAGRFAGKPEPQPEAPVATDPPARAPVDDNAAMVPSWRVREINDEKRTLADRLAALEAEKANWQRPQVQQPQPQPAAEKEAKPDPLLDPDGYDKYIEAKVETRILNDRRDLDLELTRQANTETFDKAHNEAMRLKAAGDPAFAELSRKMNLTLQPGKLLLKWHQDRMISAEVGPDPNAYFDKRLEAFLTDPANQAKVLERIRGGVQPAGNGKPAPVSLPPSLTRATNAGPVLSADDNDVSDEGLWRHANA